MNPAAELARQFGGYETNYGFGFASQEMAQAFQRAAIAAGLGPQQIMTPEQTQQANDPNGPGNGRGGSDWQNIAAMAAIIGGTGLATGGFSGLGSGGGYTGFGEPGVSYGNTVTAGGGTPSWMQPTAGGVSDTGYGAGTVPGGDGVTMQAYGLENPTIPTVGDTATYNYTGAFDPSTMAGSFLGNGGLGLLGSGLGILSGLKGLGAFGGNNAGGSGGAGGGPGGSGSGGGAGGAGSVGATTNTVSGPALAAYQRLQGIDPSAYVAAGNAAGGQYGDLAALAQHFQQLMQDQAGNALTAQGTLQGRGNELYDSGRGMQQTGQGIIAQGQPLINAGNAVWNTAQDPQNALRDRTQQRLVDASRAATSARGIGSSGESAGIENQAVSNFGIDWENNQLSRMLSGLTGMGGAYNNATNQYSAGTNVYNAGTNAYGAGNQAYAGAGQYGQLYGADLAGAMGYGAMAPQYTLASGQVPFQTQQAAYGAPLDYSNMYSTAMNTALNPNLANYNLAATRLQQQQSAAGMNALMTGLGGLNTQFNQPGSWLSTAFNGMGGGSGGGSTANSSYTPASYSAPGSYNPFPSSGYTV